MRYLVSRSRKLDDLVDNVNELIDEGWKPLGGVTAYSYGIQNQHKEYAQAMIKEDDK